MAVVYLKVFFSELPAPPLTLGTYKNFNDMSTYNKVKNENFNFAFTITSLYLNF